MQEIVIKIPDNYDLSKIQNGGIASKMILNAVVNGTVLPKGHGKIIDESAITEVYAHKTEPKEVNGIQIYPRIEIIGTNAPTIIGADKGGEM